MEIYTVKKASEILGVSARAVQKRCKTNNVDKINNKYQITENHINQWNAKSEPNEPNEPNERTQINNLIESIDNNSYILQVLKAVNENKHLEEFTREELQDFTDRLKEAKFLEVRIADYKKEIARMEDYVKDYRNTIDYLRNSLDKRAIESEKLIESIQQRNYIEAHDKGLKS
jgi:soluble cytochrome b562